MRALAFEQAVRAACFVLPDLSKGRRLEPSSTGSVPT